MGKNLKGKECGKGIYQRKDGLYSARYYAKNGKRKEKYFETLPEAKNWLADARYEERHNLIVTSPDMTVDKWFAYWVENMRSCSEHDTELSGTLQMEHSAGDRLHVHSRCKTHALQSRSESNGNYLCRFHHSAGLYHNGNRVKIGSYE